MIITYLNITLLTYLISCFLFPGQCRLRYLRYIGSQIKHFLVCCLAGIDSQTGKSDRNNYRHRVTVKSSSLTSSLIARSAKNSGMRIVRIQKCIHKQNRIYNILSSTKTEERRQKIYSTQSLFTETFGKAQMRPPEPSKRVPSGS